MNESEIKPLPEASQALNGHADYFEQIFQVPPIICGRQLKCLSIERYRLMARFKVAFVADVEKTATPGDLLMGILICGMDYSDFLEFVAQNNFQAEVKKWGRRFGFFPPAYFSWPLIGKALEKMFGRIVGCADHDYLAGEMVKFQNYILEGSKTPPYMDKTTDSRISGAHWSQSMEVVLRGEVGWTQAEIQEKNLGKALWDFYKWMENHGLVDLLSAQEDAELKKPLTPEEIAESRRTAEKILEFKHSQQAI